MSKALQFFMEDVFGESRYSGNPLAIFRNASVLTEQEMQQIAREINFSETTFILSDVEKGGGYDVRIFTPASEVPFAGHPALGTAHVIRERIIRSPVAEVVLNLMVGKITVQFSPDGILWMRQSQPGFGECLPPDLVASVLNVSEDDIEADFPVEVVSTGLPCTIVPLKSMDALSRVRVDREKYEALVARTLAKVLLVFCPGGYMEGQRLGVRVFPLDFGIAEDPATGSGNGCLGAYLVKHRYFGSDSLDIQVGQGYEIGRPSVVYIRSREEGGRYAVEIGGRVFPVAEGLWG
jgi:trans-2,3-dihydro-3-hydroxyanthranilate isomerase